MKKARRLIAVLLLFCLLLPAVGGPADAADSKNPIKKVGLSYGSSGPTAANLQNYTGAGSGFSFGYYDSSRNFVALAATAETKLTVSLDKAQDLSSGAYVSSPASADGIFCPWHLSLAVEDMAAAQSEAVRIRALGFNACPASIAGKAAVWIGNYLTDELAAADADHVTSAVGGTVAPVGGDATVFRVAVTGTDKLQFVFKSGSTGLGIYPIASGSAQPQTWFSGYRYYGGFEYLANSYGLLTVINVVDLQSYVKGVIPYEISTSWPVEAQKAQALCAKCFAYSASKHSSSGFDLCNGADCQVYRGVNAATATSDAAVEAIMGKNITYNGSPITSYYYSSNGGATESSENVWVATVGYLRGKKDPYEDPDVIPNYAYSSTITAAQVATILRNKGYAIVTVKDMYVSKYTDVGNVYTLTVVDGDGKKWDFSKATARSILGSSYVRSQHFTVTGGAASATVSVNGGAATIALPLPAVTVLGKDGAKQISGGVDTQVATGKGTVALGDGKQSGAQTGVFTVSGAGNGHNVGMSQWGIYCMAKKGMTYDQMLSFYYTGIKISDL